ncbi:putative acyl-CoA transferase/carnitine dehydratase [Mycobacterium sp. JS623]|uniref:CaiB/BaiF CoA transferase family protein n=1 Tax=Mycobacterium sp. JS623 TaxID=212767 RepID=UPI0002A56973|nr:CaiB/BaiF CoA-transferase family protein [Mycobacterium sp. JS623]AGB22198.1 putative acyl-CoA transferase/carnitine dehydratase [Mycobacterium sp. JS623]
MGSLPLDGVRVLELGNYIAAPTAGRLLADFGAEVIKVERPGSGDEIRRWRLYDGDTSMLYRTINRNKKSIVLDLASAPGRRAVVGLARHSDVVLENFRPGTLERWGIGPDVLTDVNPDLVVARISAFGQTGPMAHMPGFAAIAEAYGGLRALVGEPDRPPSRVGVSIGDTLAGIYAAFGVVMTLFDRGRRPHAAPSPAIDVALNEAVLSVTESLIPDYDAFGVVRQRTGARLEGIAPSSAYVCADGTSVVIAGNGDAIFRRLMDVIGRHDLSADPELSDNAGRWRRRDDLDEAIGQWVGATTSADALDRLQQAGVPSGPIYTAADLANDEQLRARGMIQYFDVATGAGTIRDVGFPGVVPVLDAVSVPIRSIGPNLGEHTDDVLSGLLGMSEEDIAAAVGDRGQGSA